MYTSVYIIGDVKIKNYNVLKFIQTMIVAFTNN